MNTDTFIVKNRINYIDNIRSLVILLLFPFHTFRMFTHFEPFYVQGEPQAFCDVFIAATSLWFMNMLFVLAGISISFSLKKRTMKEFLFERVAKLFIPFFFGVILTIPIQTYYAEKFHNNYQGGYMEQLRLFFTKETDLSGYFGGFTPAHLWFLLFLFLISILSLPVIIYVKKNGLPQLKKSPSLIRIIPWFLVIMLSSVVELGESLGPTGRSIVTSKKI